MKEALKVVQRLLIRSLSPVAILWVHGQLTHLQIYPEWRKKGLTAATPLRQAQPGRAEGERHEHQDWWQNSPRADRRRRRGSRRIQQYADL